MPKGRCSRGGAGLLLEKTGAKGPHLAFSNRSDGGVFDGMTVQVDISAIPNYLLAAARLKWANGRLP